MKEQTIRRPKFDDETKLKVYEKTDGCCHLCHKKIAKKNYGVIGTRGAWEVDHSKPASKGGSNHINNYQPACIPCNRKKGNSSTQSARRTHGVTALPKSKQQKTELRKRKVLGGAGTGAIVGMRFGPIGAIVGAVAGALIGSNS
jgi:5-methylcytosine-specific restriction endonuclease McrA